jgi:hypothetical protein
MKILTKFALAAMMLITTLTAQAGGVRGYYRSSGTYVAPYYRSDSGSVGRSYGSSSGYVYRNPYATSPSVNVRGYQTGLPLAVLRPGHDERSRRRDQDRCRLCAAPSIDAPNERHHALCRNAILFLRPAPRPLISAPLNRSHSKSSSA